MKYLLVILFLVSCGKSTLDSNQASTSQSQNQSALTCSMVSDCIKSCGVNPVSQCMQNISNGGSRRACEGINDSSYQNCMNQKVQLHGGGYVILTN